MAFGSYSVVGYSGNAVFTDGDTGINVISWSMTLNCNTINIKNCCDAWVSWHPGAVYASGTLVGHFTANNTPISDTVMLYSDSAPEEFDIQGQDFNLELTVDNSTTGYADITYTFQATTNKVHIDRDNRSCPVVIEWVSNGPITQQFSAIGGDISTEDEDTDDDS